MKNKVGVIIAAAGAGKRMGEDIPKQFMMVNSQPMAFLSARAFLSCKDIEEVVFVTRKDYLEYCEEHLQGAKIIVGGEERQDSIYEGIKNLSGDIKYVLVHDGARPFVSQQLIERVIKETLNTGAAICGVKVKDTIRDKHKTLKREDLIAVQTPQGFRKDILKEAYEMALQDNFQGTDDASLVELLGITPSIVEGDYKNIKITTREDLPMEYKVGQGYDVHQLVEERNLIIGGVEIPFEKGLLGHSDADVLVHAIMDSLLGALGEGDIGKHFPDSSQEFKDISSLKLLSKVGQLIASKGYDISNIDATIMAERPKMADHIENMKTNIASCLNIDNNIVNIKATTTEGLGFVGRQEGIGAQGICMLRR